MLPCTVCLAPCNLVPFNFAHTMPPCPYHAISCTMCHLVPTMSHSFLCQFISYHIVSPLFCTWYDKNFSIICTMPTCFCAMTFPMRMSRPCIVLYMEPPFHYFVVLWFPFPCLLVLHTMMPCSTIIVFHEITGYLFHCFSYGSIMPLFHCVSCGDEAPLFHSNTYSYAIKPPCL